MSESTFKTENGIIAVQISTNGPDLDEENIHPEIIINNNSHLSRNTSLVVFAKAKVVNEKRYLLLETK